MSKAKTVIALLALLFSVLVSSAVMASDRNPVIEKASQEANRGNVQAAFAILRPLAEQGDANAQYALAKIQLRKMWRDRDPDDGSKWLLKAAEQGHAAAQLDLGYYFAVEKKNYSEAIKWYRRVAEQHPEESTGINAATSLGAMYEHGLGAPRDYAEATRWYRRAAERGGVWGQYALGLIYLDEHAGTKNFDEAVKWLSSAANKRYKAAQYTLILIYAEGFDTKPNAVEAAYWYTGRRISNEGEAAYHVGKFYSEGFFALPERQRVLTWLYHRRGVADSAIRQYMDQISGERWGDEDKAVHWYRIGAEAGFVGAQVNLAGIYWNTESSYWNCAEAMKWTRLAADKANPTALANVGIFYAHGPRERVVNAIGLGMESTEKGIQAMKVLSGSPAEAAGIRSADYIVEVNGKDASKFGVHGIVNAVRASKGKEIVLRVRRGSDGALKTISIMPHETRYKCPGADAAGLRRDPAEAVRWFERAADLGSLGGLFYLAQAYQKGNGVSQDYKKAMELYESGASRGDWEAAQEISHMYANGEAGEKNNELSDKWFRKALDLKHKAVRH